MIYVHMRARTMTSRPKAVIACLLLALVTSHSHAQPSTSQNPVWAAPVRIQGGLLVGLREDSLTVYRGIPFAAPPVGELRWRAPQPPNPWAGVQKAGTFKPACMQQGPT